MVFGQKPKPITLDEIISKLTLNSQNEKSADENNRQPIEEISERKVNFSLDEQGEKSLKKAGASDLLITAIYLNSTNKIEEQKVLYQSFVDNYSGSLQQRKIALEAAKEFVRKYSDDKESEKIIEYFKTYIGVVSTPIDPEICCDHPPRNPLYFEFDKAFRSEKWSKVFEIGEKILIKEPEFIDITLTLASVGFDITVSKSNRSYLNETLYYAEKSVELLNNKVSSEHYGVYRYQYKTKEFPDGKGNALGYMNYIIGYIKYFYLDQKNAGIGYFRKALQFESRANRLIRDLDVFPKTQK